MLTTFRKKNEASDIPEQLQGVPFGGQGAVRGARSGKPMAATSHGVQILLNPKFRALPASFISWPSMIVPVSIPIAGQNGARAWTVMTVSLRIVSARRILWP
jgi:hypothetical protein